MNEILLASLIGLATTSSAMAGTAIGLYCPLSKRSLACILAFAAGALIRFPSGSNEASSLRLLCRRATRRIKRLKDVLPDLASSAENVALLRALLGHALRTS